MIAPRPKNRVVRIVIEATVPGDISEGDFINAMPRRDMLSIPVGDGERTIRRRLRYRRFSAVIAPLAAVETVAQSMERNGFSFSLTGALRGAVRQLKGA